MRDDAGCPGPGSVGGLSPSGHGDYGDAQQLGHCANSQRGFNAIDAWKAYVHEYYARTEDTRLLDCLLAGGGGQNRVSLELQKTRERGGCVAVVIDHHDAGPFAPRSLARDSRDA